MKRNPDYFLSDVADSHILVPVGEAAVNFNSIISLNEMGQTIWNMLAEDTTEEALLGSILAEYDVSETQARADLGSFLAKLREHGCIED